MKIKCRPQNADASTRGPNLQPCQRMYVREAKSVIQRFRCVATRARIALLDEGTSGAHAHLLAEEQWSGERGNDSSLACAM